MPTLDALTASPALDVLIAGGGLAGLCLARQLRRAHPDLRVAVIEKTARPLPEACHKVGESSVEVGSQYFERLGLEAYLLEKQIVKFGLRFFPGGGDREVAQRAEIGPAQEPIVRSYQLDRGMFESDMRDMIAEDGAILVEGAAVRDVALEPGDAPHRVTVRAGDETAEVTCRWFIDATGRAAFLRKRMRSTRGTRHDAHAGWFRIDGRFDINEMAPASEEAWHNAPGASDRWRSTNHFMGPGYWAWVIPLSSGKTSIGLVVHGDTHDFDAVRSEARVRAFLAEHEPALARHLAERPALDFQALKGYSHNVGRAWSADRWGVVGEAGAFVDPFYSPGSDFIALANSFTEELIRSDIAGDDLAVRAGELSVQYRALVLGSTDVYRTASPVYAHARAMLTKIYWDNFAYWCFPAQYFLREIYRLSGSDHAPFAKLGQRFVEMSAYVQSLLAVIAETTEDTLPTGFHGMPAFPSLLVDTHLALQNDMSPAETLEYMSSRAVEGEQIVAELLLRTVLELGEDRARELVETVGALKWDISLTDERIEAEPTIGLARRRALTPIVRDVERSLGRVTAATSLDAARDILAPLIRPSA